MVPKLGLPNLDMDHSKIFGSFKIHVTCLGVPSEKIPGKKLKTTSRFPRKISSNRDKNWHLD